MTDLKEAQAHDIDINYVAELARIKLSDDQKQKLTKELESLLQYFDKLNQVDVSGVEPAAHAFAFYNVWQDDEPGGTFEMEKVMSNAPAQRDNQIMVPKVVE